MLSAPARHRRGVGPRVGARVVDLGRGQEFRVRVAAGYEDAAILQSGRGMIGARVVKRRAGHPAALRRPKDIHPVHRRPVRPAPLDPTGDHHQVLPRGRHALMHSPEQPLWKERDAARRRIDQLALTVHHVQSEAIESSDHENFAVRQRERTRVGARLRELTDRLPVRCRRGCAARSARRYHEDDRECEELPHCAWRVTLPIGTP